MGQEWTELKSRLVIVPSSDSFAILQSCNCVTKLDVMQRVHTEGGYPVCNILIITGPAKHLSLLAVNDYCHFH